MGSHIEAQLRVTWFIVLIGMILSVVPLVLGYIQWKNNEKSAIGFINFGSNGFDTFLTAYSVTESVMSVVGTLVLIRYCRELMKRETASMLTTKEGAMQLDQIAVNHCSLLATNPAVAYFTTHKISIPAILCLLVPILGHTLDAYKSLMSVTVNKRYEWPSGTLKSASLTMPMMSLQRWSFSTTTAVDSGHIGSVNTGAFSPSLYFSRYTAAESSYLTASLANGSIPLFGTLPSVSLDTTNSIANMPFITQSFSDYSYTIITETAPGVYGSIAFSNSKESIILTNTATQSAIACIQTKLSPWNNCTIPSVVPFTIYQVLPTFQGVYAAENFTTTLFNLRRSASSVAQPSIYRLTGNLVLNRTQVVFSRDSDQNPTAAQSYVSSFDVAAVEELYKKAACACILNFVANFNSSVAASQPYYWSLLEEFSVQGSLLWSDRNYALADLVTEMQSRLTTTSQYWIRQMSTVNNPYSLSMVTGKMVQMIEINVALLAGFIVMGVWLATIFYMIFAVFAMKKERTKAYEALPAPKKLKTKNLSEFANEVWEHAYSVTLLANWHHPGVDTQAERVRIRLGEEQSYLPGNIMEANSPNAIIRTAESVMDAAFKSVS
ncbi:hypothetical protein HDV03_000513 [Kappamyces sp. JEL0829]|nr:hypothetical protein HDV03_000513 [Kappamyces sp. JEL0829]